MFKKLIRNNNDNINLYNYRINKTGMTEIPESEKNYRTIGREKGLGGKRFLPEGGEIYD